MWRYQVIYNNFIQTKSLIYLWHKISKAIKNKCLSSKKFSKNPNTVDTKPVIIEQTKTSYKFSKTIRQAEKVGSNSSFYSDTKKRENV